MYAIRSYYAACGKAWPDRLPQQRADLVAYEAVQDAPGLLCLDLSHVEGSRGIERRANGSAGYLAKLNPLVV